MKKRLLIGLVAGGLMAAMLPGVVSAARPNLHVTISCELVSTGVVQTWANNPAGQPAGEAQRSVRDFMREDLELVLLTECVHGTRTTTIERVL